jgi:aspartate/methionine/tyrosine aminotransferase
MPLPPLAERTEPFVKSSFKRIFELSDRLPNPINLGVGQPHFDVPIPLIESAVRALLSGKNRYTQAIGIPELRHKIKSDLDGRYGKQHDVIITCGTNGALTLALQALLDPGDELIVFDPYFVVYPQLARLVGAQVRMIDTYPDFQPDPDRVAAAVTPLTKALILCSPGNPTGVVVERDRAAALAELADRQGILLISDEIYSTFVYDDSFTSPAAHGENVLVCSSFSKTHGMTGWRLGYAYGPPSLITAMAGLQQATFVCAPSMAQPVGIAAWDYPMDSYISDYKAKRDRLLDRLDPRYRAVKPSGAFYLFPQVPWGTASSFAETALGRRLVVMPGMVFSRSDTHFRISYGVEDKVLDEGIAILNELAAGGC